MANTQRCTTADVTATVRLILGRASDVLDQPSTPTLSLVSKEQARRAIAAAEAAQGYPPSAQQRAAVLRVVTCGQAVQTVVGGPGSRKTTMLRAARLAWEAGGLVVAGAATQGDRAEPDRRVRPRGADGGFGSLLADLAPRLDLKRCATGGE
jgi:hypothetical protein